MKEVKAYIKPHRLPDVTFALQQIEGLSGMSISEVKGLAEEEQKAPPTESPRIFELHTQNQDRGHLS